MRTKAWRFGTAVLLGVALVVEGGDVAAQQSADLSGAMHDYYDGEKGSGWLWGGVGVTALGTGTVLLLQDGELEHGIAYPVLGIGALQTAIGTVLLLRSDAKIRDGDARIAASPATFRSEELEHVKGTNTSFLVIEIVEAVLIAGGTTLAIVSHGKKSDTWKGVGIGVAAQGAAMLTLDALASARSHRYERALEGVTLSTSPALLLGGAPTLTVGGRF